MARLTVGGPASDPELVLSARNAAGFNVWLRGQLKARNMSQRQLAQRSGVDHSSISRLLRGDRVPSLGTAMKLARSVSPPDRSVTSRRVGFVPGSHPAARVEYALRADDHLSEADVREIMLYYLAARRRGLATSHETPTPQESPEHRRIPRRT